MTTLRHPTLLQNTGRALAVCFAAVARRASVGAHPWGVIDITPFGRTALSRYRVTVYAPGTNSRERQWLQAQRNLPVLGSFGMLVALVVFGQ